MRISTILIVLIRQQVLCTWSGLWHYALRTVTIFLSTSFFFQVQKDGELRRKPVYYHDNVALSLMFFATFLTAGN